MFGYLKPCTPELKVKDLEKFKAYYCGLCHSIKNIYGNIPRLTLNYDMTFLAILLDGLSESKIKYEKIVCPIHPLTKKALVCDNDALIYASHMNISLFYYKLLDDIKDDNNIKSHILCLMLKPKILEHSKNLGDVNLEICYNLNELSKLEKEPLGLSIDEICHPFSSLTASVVSSYEGCSISKEDKDNLYHLGYSLGKWIYLIDALDDLKKDIKSGSFNAINSIYNKDSLDFINFKKEIINKIEELLISCGSQCLYYLEKLPLKKNKDLILNIIHLGIMEKTETLTKGVIHNE